LQNLLGSGGFFFGRSAVAGPFQLIFIFSAPPLRVASETLFSFFAPPLRAAFETRPLFLAPSLRVAAGTRLFVHPAVAGLPPFLVVVLPLRVVDFYITVAGAFLISRRRETNSTLAAVAVQ